MVDWRFWGSLRMNLDGSYLGGHGSEIDEHYIRREMV